ncbi:arsenate reductase [Legionella busanensis]|uniref:Arsenate reductase n=1 Tax=Legionella busanensis TaxID=190655 RepID=A0A378JL32_9GAMM|nr:arsenate reductase (glutaredoxin) [Legionella busanensis]STX51904.1 arsenate reductase [Legionella busanensis]
MQEITIYYNPLCSKSRKALEILEDKGFKPTVVEYLKTPLTFNQLKSLRSYFKLEDFVRTTDKSFKELGLSLNEEDKILQAMEEEPALMQRPIVTFKGKAVIGRPPEKVLELFD